MRSRWRSGGRPRRSRSTGRGSGGGPAGARASSRPARCPSSPRCSASPPRRTASRAPRGSAARAQARGGVDPLRISSRIASLPASKAFRRRCVCSSKSSRLLSSHSPARPCASAASPCAFFATSPLRWVRSWRVSSPVLGASKRAAAAPSAAPKRNQPMYAPPSPLWSLMVISLFLSEALNEHPQALLEPHCHADELPGARQAAQHPHEPREPIGHALDLVGHRADALELAARLADEPADVLGQRVGLAHEGPELLCDRRQHALGAQIGRASCRERV